jgi:DNA-binding NarL/FixJ family response regulator
MYLPQLLLVTPDALLASSLGRVLAELYQIITRASSPSWACLEELAPDTDSRGDLVVVDARHLAPAEVADFVAGFDHPSLVMIAPRGLRTESIPAGVRGALTHLSDIHEVRVALDVVRSGQRYLSPHFAAEDRLRYWQLPTPPTDRQRQVFELKRRGLKNEEIASELGLTRKAVEAIATELRIGLGLDPRETFDWRDGRLP